MNDIIKFEKSSLKGLNNDGTYTINSANGGTSIITNKTQAESLARADYLVAVAKESNKGLCYELSTLTWDKLKNFGGYKSISKMLADNFISLSEDTINTYRKVGKMFVTREEIVKLNKSGKPCGESIVYGYRKGIPNGASITNLGKALALLGMDRSDWADIDYFDEDYINEKINEFIEKYLTLHDGEEDILLHLEAPLSVVKAEVAALTGNAKRVDKGNSIKDNTSDNGTTNVSEIIKTPEIWTEVLANIVTHFRGNADIENAVALLINAINEEKEQEQ